MTPISNPLPRTLIIDSAAAAARPNIVSNIGPNRIVTCLRRGVIFHSSPDGQFLYHRVRGRAGSSHVHPSRRFVPGGPNGKVGIRPTVLAECLPRVPVAPSGPVEVAPPVRDG
jgi:hypothetical protein